ncbi:MAG: Ig-like domain-containing protein [bacterium]
MYGIRLVRNTGSMFLLSLVVFAAACSDAASPKARLVAPTESHAVAAADPLTVAANECATPKTGWIFCDDFESDRLSKYFDYDNASGKFARSASAGVSGSTGMRSTFTKGQQSAGSLKLAFGRTPSSAFRPADAGTANYREVYWRFFVRREAGWVGNGAGKLTRATIFAKSDWSQAMIAHGWTSDSDNRYLMLDPASGTSTSGSLITAGYNDFTHLRWLGGTKSAAAEEDQTHVGQWACYEYHVKLNDAGQSNGVFEFSVNGQSSARLSTLNFVGAYNTYGLNAVFLEQYQNEGAPAANVRTLDNFVVSTQPIGCGSSQTVPPVQTVASVGVVVDSATLTTPHQSQAKATLRDVAGNVMTGAVTWSSSDNAIASVTSSGVVTAVTPGTATISATSSAITGSASVTVVAPASTAPVASVTVSVAPASVPMGTTSQATATTLDASGKVLTGRVVAWYSSNTSIATISASGVITPVKPGAIGIYALSEGRSGVTAFTATAAAAAPAVPVATVSVSLAPASIKTAGTSQGAAVTKDASGNMLTGRVTTWASSNAAVASVDAAGVVTGMSAGSANITATSEGHSGASTVTVQAAAALPATHLTITTQPIATLLGAVFGQQPSVQLRDASNGAVGQAGVVVTAGANGIGALLGGTTTAVTNASGLATFSNLSLVSVLGTTLSVTFSAPGLGSVVSGTSAVVTTPPPPPPPSGSCANEPTGYTAVNDQPWDQSPAYNVRSSMGWTDDGGNGGSALSIVNDPTSPFQSSNHNVIAGLFPGGMAGGGAPFSIYHPFASSEQYRNLYICLYLKHDATFDNTNGNTGTKFLWPAADQSGGTQTYTGHDGASMNFQVFQQGAVDRQIQANLNPTNAVLANLRGTWVRYEMLFKASSSNSAKDGELHVWINGVETHRYTDVAWQMSAARTWLSLTWNPTYGGGTHTVPRNQYQYMDNIHISGSNK